MIGTLVRSIGGMSGCSSRDYGLLLGVLAQHTNPRSQAVSPTCDDAEMSHDEFSQDDARRHALERLEYLDAFAAAIDRRTEVFEAIAASPSADDARTTIADLLGISDSGAVAVLDLQWRRLAELERGRIFQERDDLRRTLD